MAERERQLQLIQTWSTPIDHGQPPRAVDVYARRRFPYPEAHE